MRRAGTQSFISIVICFLLVPGVALANSKQDKVTLPFDVVVGGTTVKKGTYKVEFDPSTGELSIVNGKRVVAKATTRAEPREEKARRTELTYVQRNDGQVLESITFAGEYTALMVGETGSASGQR